MLLYVIIHDINAISCIPFALAGGNRDGSTSNTAKNGVEMRWPVHGAKSPGTAGQNRQGSALKRLSRCGSH